MPAAKKKKKKKTMGRGVDSLFGESKRTPSASKTDRIRSTFYLDKENLEAVKALAWYNKEGISDVLNEMLASSLKAKKKAIGEAVKAYRR